MFDENDIDLTAMMIIDLNGEESQEESDDVYEVSNDLPFEKIEIQCRKLSQDMTYWKTSAPCFKKYQWKHEENNTVKVKIPESTFIESFCTGCDFKTQCLLTAICYRDEHLIWGGLLPEQRRKIIDDLIDSDPNFFKFWKPENLNIIIQHIDGYFTPSQAVLVKTAR